MHDDDNDDDELPVGSKPFLLGSVIVEQSQLITVTILAQAPGRDS